VLLRSVVLATVLAVAPSIQPAFTLPDMTGLVEGIGYRARTGAFYFGDVHLRCVWLRTRDGRVRRFTAPDEQLLGIFRVAVDEPRRALWASMGALPEMAGFTDAVAGAGGIAEIDVESGRVRRVVRAPADGGRHLLGDLVVLADGTVYATDTTAPVVWRLAPNATVLESVAPAATFTSLQGITPSADGRGLFLTDYPVGVVYLDLSTKATRTLAVPDGVNVRGCDTLVRAPDGSLIAVQNGTKQQRVLRLTVDAGATAITAVEVLAADATMVDATLGTIAGPDFVFIADGGWNRFGAGKADVTPRGVPVVRLPLGSAVAERPSRGH
jgi:sugar lactone lactonase YvrE